MPVLLLAVLCLLAALRTPFAPALAGEPEIMASFSAGRALAEPAIERIILAALAERRVTVAGATLELAAFSSRPARHARHRTARLSAGGPAIQCRAQRRHPGQPAQRFTVAGRLRQEVQMPVLNRRLQGRGNHRLGSAMGFGAGSGIAGQRRLRAAGADRPDSAARPARWRSGPRRRPEAAGGRQGCLGHADPEHRQHAADGARPGAGEGGIGDVISVANAQSRTIVAGVVIANGQVAVDATGMPPSR